MQGFYHDKETIKEETGHSAPLVLTLGIFHSISSRKEA